MIKIIVFALLGKLTIYLAQSFPFTSIPLIGIYWKEGRFWGKLFACDLCLGVWVYTLSAILLKVNLFEEFGYIPIVFEFFTGMAMSFIIHLLTIGWRDKFEVIHIGE